jgi:hypothetical protein
MRVGVMLMLVAGTAAGDSGGRAELAPRLQYEAMAALAAREPRAELSCPVTPGKPMLGFDLRFHSDFQLGLPVKALSDAGGWLQVAMRVTPVAETENSVYLAHRVPISGVPVDGKGEIILTGGFDHGPGRYRVDWLMRDARERVCASHWELEARAGTAKQDVPLTLGPNQIVDVDGNRLSNRPQINRDVAQQLRIKVLLDLSPAKPQDSILRSADAAVLLSILHSVVDRPAVAVSALVAFNLRNQTIMYRQENAGQVNFLALERAMQSPTSGTIDVSLLRDPRSETHFVTGLLTGQLSAQTDPPDAIVIVGAKVSLGRKISLNSLKAKGSATCPIFYLNYNSNPDEPWPDTIGRALKAYKTAATYDIVLPRDVGGAMKELLARIVKRPSPKSQDSLF